MAITPRKNGNNREQVGGNKRGKKCGKREGKKGERWMEDGWKKRKKYAKMGKMGFI